MTCQSGNGFNRQFVNLWFAQGISQFGDALLEVTLPIWVGFVTKSPIQVAGVAVMELLPSILVGPLAGVIAERFNPKIIMGITDLFRASIVLLLLEFHNTGSAYLAYTVSFLLSLGTRIFVPAQSVLFRSLIQDKSIFKAQGAFRTASSISLVLGPAVGGTLLLTCGPTITVIIDSFTFVVSSIFVLNLHQENNRLSTKNEFTHLNFTSMRKEVMCGIRFMLRSRSLVIITLITGSCSLVGFVWFTVDVFYVKTYLRVSAESVGYLWTASGLGDLLAGFAVVLIASKRLESLWVVTAGLLIRAVSLMYYAMVGQFRYALLACLISGFASGFISTTTSALAMKLSPSTMMGRISSILDMIGQFSGVGATVFICTLNSDLTSQQDLLACAALLLLVSVIVLYQTKYARTLFAPLTKEASERFSGLP